MSMKNSNDTIGNRTRELPTCEKFVVIYKIEMSSVNKNINNLLGVGLLSKSNFALYSGKYYMDLSEPKF
jgi:predicted transcriptional regulator